MTLNSSSSSPLISNYAPVNYRQQTSGDVFGGQYPIQTPQGIVHTTQQSQLAPPLPPRPNSLFQTTSSAYSPYGNNFGYGSFGSGYGSYGMGGYNSFNSFGYGGFGRPQFGGGNPLDPEMRFIQLAEESSRSTFQSIESVVSTIGNIATMLDSTYFALTSSFRAILGLAANFSHLRGFFSRFFSTFAIFRSIIWIYKKLLYMIGLSKVNPSTQINLSEAFKDAEKIQSNDFFNTSPSQNSSGLAMVLFLTFVFTAPYLIMKLFGSLMSSTADQSKNPSSWINPIEAVVLYNFNADHPSELSVKAGQIIRIAPKEIQQLNRLLSTNWVLATTDGVNVGLVPVNYIKRNDTSFIPTNNTSTRDIPSIQSQINNQQQGQLNTQDQPTAIKEDINTEPPEITDKNDNIS